MSINDTNLNDLLISLVEYDEATGEYQLRCRLLNPNDVADVNEAVSIKEVVGYDNDGKPYLKLYNP